MHIKLSRRLQQLADFVPRGSKVADIGTDHAYLPIYLVKNNISPLVVAGDINPGPIKTAQGQVEGYNVSHLVAVRQGNGLAVVKPGEVDAVILAGMGGSTIIEIIENHPQVVKKLKNLILQPMVAADKVRDWLYKHNWIIIDEELLEEDGRLYEIILAEQGKTNTENSIELQMGRILLQKKHPLLIKLYEKEIQAQQVILYNLAKSNSEVASEKAKEIKKRIEEIKRVIDCHLNVKL